MGFSGGSEVKNLPVMRETWVQSLGWEDPLEKGIAIYVCVCVCVCVYVYVFIYLFLQKGIIQDTLLVVNFMAHPSRSDHAFFFL